MRFVRFLFALMQSADAPRQGSTITLACNAISKFVATSGAELKLDPITNLRVIVSAGSQAVSFLRRTDYEDHPLLFGFSSQYASGRPTISGQIDQSGPG